MALRIAQVKVVPEKGKLAENFARFQAVLDEIAPQQPDVVVTTEGYLDGYVCVEKEITACDMARYAIDPDESEYARAVSAWALGHSCCVIFGCSRIAAGKVYNSALIYDRAGARIGHFDKVHLQTHDLKYAAGDSLPVFEADFGKFGVLICADRRWPETVRTLTLQGARIIFNPSFGMHDDLNLCMMRTRSFESEVYICFTHPEQALVTDPYGAVVTNDTSPDHRAAITEIDLGVVEQARSRSAAHLRDRRPDVYRL